MLKIYEYYPVLWIAVIVILNSIKVKNRNHVNENN